MVDISPNEMNEYRNNIIAYVLNNIQNKFPIKQADVIAHVFGKNIIVFKTIMPLAINILKESHGIVVKEIKDPKSVKKYICYSEWNAKSVNEYDEEQLTHLTLLFIVLSHIFMCRDRVYENNLLNFLEGLHIYFDETHPYFGCNIKILVTEKFVKQLYLKKEKFISELESEETYIYSWGYRSEVEFNKMLLLKKAANLLGKPAINFLAQYNNARI